MFGARVAGFLMQPTDQPSRLPPPATLMGRVHQFVRQRVATRMRVHGVTLQDGSILHADDVVLAAGNHVPMLARKAGVAVPVCPVKVSAAALRRGWRRVLTPGGRATWSRYRLPRTASSCASTLWMTPTSSTSRRWAPTEVRPPRAHGRTTS